MKPDKKENRENLDEDAPAFLPKFNFVSIFNFLAIIQMHHSDPKKPKTKTQNPTQNRLEDTLKRNFLKKNPKTTIKNPNPLYKGKSKSDNVK